MSADYTYFDVDGIPYRVEGYGSVIDMKVEFYKKGDGFVEGNSSTPISDGVMISEKRFKELMVKKMLPK